MKYKIEEKIDDNAQILGVMITGTRKSQVIGKIKLQRKNLCHVATINPEFVIEARHNKIFANALNTCEIAVADGWGVVWALKLLEGKSIDRISGVEIAEEIMKYANDKEKKVFLLGARQGIAEKAAKIMQAKYPHVRLAWYEGAQTVAVEKDEEASMTIAKINTFEPDYLFVAYGSPWQDIWIEENRPYLRVGLAIGVGGTLDEWANAVKTCPKWIDGLGLKWLFRLVNEPWRLGRQMRLLEFMWLVKWELVKRMYYKFID
ncbi:MAG: WecB/TagA/CpsF family glycosyltransferase [bacterium]